MHKQFRLEKAIELDIKLKLAGVKEGYRKLNSILNEDKIEEAKKLNTNEATKENRVLLEKIMCCIKEENYGSN